MWYVWVQKTRQCSSQNFMVDLERWMWSAKKLINEWNQKIQVQCERKQGGRKMQEVFENSKQSHVDRSDTVWLKSMEERSGGHKHSLKGGWMGPCCERSLYCPGKEASWGERALPHTTSGFNHDHRKGQIKNNHLGVSTPEKYQPCWPLDTLNVFSHINFVPLLPGSESRAFCLKINKHLYSLCVHDILE